MSFPCYADYKPSGTDWICPLPSTWAVVRLKHACSVSPSNVDKKSYDDEVPIQLCNYTDVYYNDEITSLVSFMPATASADQAARFGLLAGDVIITKDSETADDIAVSSFVPEALPGVVCGYHLALIRSRGCGEGRYIKRLFDSHNLRGQVAVAANGLTRVGLSQYALDNLVIPLPPLADQIAISEFLEQEISKIDRLVTEQRRLMELLKEKRQAVISHAVTKGLNPDAPMKDSGIEWLGEVPAHWQVLPLRHVAAVVRGASPRPAGDPRFFNGDAIPWVTVAEITKDSSVYLMETETFLTVEGAHHSNRFSAGTLIYSNSGATLGVPKILGIDACANDGVVAFLDLNDQVRTEFLYYYLTSITDQIRDKIKQGSGQPNLNTDIVKDLRFPLPPLPEQERILGRTTELVRGFDLLTTEALRASDLLLERRSALISAAVTGQIDVRGLAS